MKTLRDYIDLLTQLSEAPGDVTVPGGGSITNVDPNSAEGKAMIARSQAVQAGKSPDSAAPAAGQAATPAPAAAASAAAAPKTWNKGVLGKGTKGPEVSALQKKLGIADTGTYDAATIAAVQALQKKLGVAADGAYGPGTKAAHDKMPPATNAAADAADGVNQGAQGQKAAPVNVAPTGQPPATAAQPALGTKQGATQAIPTGPVNANNPSGVGAKADIPADQAQAALDNGSEYDIKRLGGRERLQQLAGVKPATGQTATPTPAAGQAATTTPAAAPAQTPAAAPAATDDFLDAPVAASALTPQQQALAKSAGFATNKTDATALAQQNLAAAQSGETAGGASTARRVVPATGARAQQLQRQQAGNQMPESRDTPFQKQLNAMKRIAGLKDNGL